MNSMILDYARKTGIFLSGNLLKRLKDSFYLEKQSFLELQNFIGMSIAKFGMNGQLTIDESKRKSELLPDFELYWLSLELFSHFLDKAFNRKTRIFDVHLTVQLEGYINQFEK